MIQATRRLAAFLDPIQPARTLRIGLGLVALLAAPLAAHADLPLNLSAEIGLSADDNVGRASDKWGDDKRSDRVWNAGLSASRPVPTSAHTRVVLAGFAGEEKFATYGKLTHTYYGAQGEFQYRASGEFGAPTYGFVLRSAGEQYKSDLRDGFRHSAGLTVRKLLTDRISSFASLSYLRRDGRSAVFDTREMSARVNLDYSLSRASTLYLSADARHGETVSSGRPALAYVDVAKALVADDAFENAGFYAYKVSANTLIGTIGCNVSFGAGHALDLSLRRAQSKVLGADLRYTATQASLAYLVRF
jgi:hypothetical protein